MNIIELDASDDHLVDELIALKNDVSRADTPERPLPNARGFRNGLRRVRPWTAHERWIAMVDERVVGYLHMGLPLSSNTGLAEIELVVHPGYRRQRIGEALLQQAHEVAARHDRRTLTAGTLMTWEDGPRRPEGGELFLQRAGFEPALTEVLRVLDFDENAARNEQRLHNEAERASADYRIVPYSEHVPDELVASMAELSSSFLEQAPIGELDLERESIGVERVRQAERDAIEDGVVNLGVLAVDPAGTVVAVTEIRVPSEPGTWAYQEITLVDSEHRGHRLGLRVKLENHRQLRRLCPEVETIETGNAAVNQHMIGINEQLGFRPLDAHREYQRKL